MATGSTTDDERGDTDDRRPRHCLGLPVDHGTVQLGHRRRLGDRLPGQHPHEVERRQPRQRQRVDEVLLGQLLQASLQDAVGQSQRRQQRVAGEHERQPVARQIGRAHV